MKTSELRAAIAAWVARDGNSLASFAKLARVAEGTVHRFLHNHHRRQPYRKTLERLQQGLEVARRAEEDECVRRRWGALGRPFTDDERKAVLAVLRTNMDILLPFSPERHLETIEADPELRAMWRRSKRSP